jgi:hypothetical protein
MFSVGRLREQRERKASGSGPCLYSSLARNPRPQLCTGARPIPAYSCLLTSTCYPFSLFMSPRFFVVGVLYYYVEFLLLPCIPPSYAHYTWLRVKYPCPHPTKFHNTYHAARVRQGERELLWCMSNPLIHPTYKPDSYMFVAYSFHMIWTKGRFTLWTMKSSHVRSLFCVG